MNAQEIIAKADRGEGLTEEEIKVYRQAVKPVKHTYGKYGTLKRQYLEEKGIGQKVGKAIVPIVCASCIFDFASNIP